MNARQHSTGAVLVALLFFAIGAMSAHAVTYPLTETSAYTLSTTAPTAQYGGWRAQVNTTGLIVRNMTQGAGGANYFGVAAPNRTIICRFPVNTFNANCILPSITGEFYFYAENGNVNYNIGSGPVSSVQYKTVLTISNAGYNGPGTAYTVGSQLAAGSDNGATSYGVQSITFDTLLTGPPVITALNCTSCNPPFGSTNSPYLTSDTTPTFTFNTTVTGRALNANCRVGNQDLNYTGMGATRQCMGGEGTSAHTCTLTAQDALPPEAGLMYIACQNLNDFNESAKSSSGPLQIIGIATTPQSAIDYGIHSSVVWPQAGVYQNQQVYLRDVNNRQLQATVDRVVVYGNQRWLINYNNQTTLGLFNMTPVVYSLELSNLTLLQIEAAVTGFINSTKQ